MLRNTLAMTLMLTLIASCAVASCASREDVPVDYCLEAPVSPTTALNNPPVSYARDVLPIFKQSCSGGSFCHGAHGAVSFANKGVFLGDLNDPASDDRIRESLIGKPTSNARLAMPYVDPGNPSNSFLMRKMDGDQCFFASQCFLRGCGGRMPTGGTPVETRDTVRRWIAQGAKNN